MVVLIYHRVHPAIDPMAPNEVTAEVFEWQMNLLRDFLTPIDLVEAIALRDQGNLPQHAVAVTFDDGYADNFDVALPILQRAGVPATFFVTTGFLDGGRMWNDTVTEAVRHLPEGTFDLRDVGLGPRTVTDLRSRRELSREIIKSIKHLAPDDRQAKADALGAFCRETLPRNLMMTRGQVRGLAAAGMTVGAHTLTHPILKALPAAEARCEIEGGRRELGAIIGNEPQLFAYPNGRPGSDYGPDHCAMVQAAGYLAAFSTIRGAVGPRTDQWQLPRFTPWDRTRWRFLARLLLEYGNVA